MKKIKKEVKKQKAHYVDVNKNISFSLFDKLWWLVRTRLKAVGDKANDIILPLNTTIKNLRQLCDLPFMEQNGRVKYWDANKQRYERYSPVICQYARETIPVGPGRPYRTYANQTWKGEIY